MTPQDFIAKWQGADGSERANYQPFFNELCDLLGVDRPPPSKADNWHNTYSYERYIDARDGESAGNARFIDTYRRGCFICEAKSFDLGKNTETAAPATPPDARAARGLGADRKLFKAKSHPKATPATCPNPNRARRS